MNRKRLGVRGLKRFTEHRAAGKRSLKLGCLGLPGQRRAEGQEPSLRVSLRRNVTRSLSGDEALAGQWARVLEYDTRNSVVQYQCKVRMCLPALWQHYRTAILMLRHAGSCSRTAMLPQRPI